MYRAGALLLLRRRGRAHARAPAARDSERTRAAATRAPARQLTPAVQGTTGQLGARPRLANIMTLLISSIRHHVER